MPFNGQLIALEQGTVGVGFVFASAQAIESAALAAQVIRHHDMIVALPANSPSVRKRFIGPEELRLMPVARGSVASFSDIDGSAPVVPILDPANFAVVSCDASSFAALSSVAAGLCAAVLPKETVDLSQEGVVFHPAKPPARCSTWLELRRNESEQSVTDFVNAVRSAATSCSKSIGRFEEPG